MMRNMISAACFEHVENLPEMVYLTTRLLKKNGKLCVSIPNEGRFLWKFAYTITTGREFERRYGLKYETIMRHEHINAADEIEQILKYYYRDARMSLLGIGKTFSMFRYYECSAPVIRNKKMGKARCHGFIPTWAGSKRISKKNIRQIPCSWSMCIKL